MLESGQGQARSSEAVFRGENGVGQLPKINKNGTVNYYENHGTGKPLPESHSAQVADMLRQHERVADPALLEELQQTLQGLETKIAMAKANIERGGNMVGVHTQILKQLEDEKAACEVSIYDVKTRLSLDAKIIALGTTKGEEPEVSDLRKAA